MQYLIPIVSITLSLFFLVFITDNALLIPTLGFPVLVLLFLGIILFSVYTMVQSKPKKEDPTQNYKNWLDKY